jgi:dipeptidase E
LREGSWLHVEGDSIILKGPLSARVFEYEKTPYEVMPKKELNALK